MHARKAVKLLNVKFLTIYVLEVQVSILCLYGLLFLKVFLSFNTILCATSEPGFLIKQRDTMSGIATAEETESENRFSLRRPIQETRQEFLS